MSDKSFTYRVCGKGNFPTDMLRYDMAYPADGDSAALLAFDHMLGDEAYDAWRKDNRVVTLKSARHPTEARWSSFGWTVLNERIFDGLSNEAVVASLNRGVGVR